jgi:hypothetical protein
MTSPLYLLGALLAATPAAGQPAAPSGFGSTGPPYLLRGASPTADFSRLPRFSSSDPAWDAFTNEYFMRHLSVDARGVYWGLHILPGAVDHLWTIESDAWFLPWVDRGAMGLERQKGSDNDVIRTTLARLPVDKHGYAFGSLPYPEPLEMIGGYRPLFGWPWPKYNRNSLPGGPTGWDFNDLADGGRDRWSCADMDLQQGYPDFCLKGQATGSTPTLTSPPFDMDVFQVPIVELDISYGALAGRDPLAVVRGLRLEWTTDDAPEFSAANAVGPDFSVLPPDQYPACYGPPYSAPEPARFALYFPMFLHPGWGREDRRVRQMRLVTTGPGNEGVQVALNYLRATYDVRLSTSNANLIRCVGAFALWSGDWDYVRDMMPNLRRAMLFLLEHLRGRQEAVPCFDWIVGHDGLGGPEIGHGLIGSYWDLLPAGRYDLESSLLFREALLSLAALEEGCARRGIAVPEVSVLGPDNATAIAYRETPEALRALAERSRERMQELFWVPETGRFCRNVDVTGVQQDYGFLHFNVLALALGVGTPAQRESILSWLDGRVVAGDTSTGEDIYHWRFAPRTSTRRNEDYYFWPWVEGMKEPGPYHSWGNQMQDGGAVPWTSFFELVTRAQAGEQQQVDRAFARTWTISQWFADVKAAGGDGQQFYRAYYNGHPERGLQQGGGPPGGLGLDNEFLSDASLGTAFVPFAFLGLSATEDGVLSVAPAVPSALEWLAAENVCYRGNYLRIKAGGGYVSLEGSRLPNAEGLSLDVHFRAATPGQEVLVDDQPITGARPAPEGGLVVRLPLRACRVALR